MRAVVGVVYVLASVPAVDSVDYLESGSLSLLQTAVEVKGHNHVSAAWLPGSGYVVNKCGKGGNLADIRPDLAGWTGGDAHAVGTQKIDNAPTKEGCIENVLKDPRCQLEDKKAEIDARNNQPEYVARNKPFAYNIAAGYAPGQAKCFCSWGTVESQKDGTGNPMSSGWITCLARGGGKPKDETPEDFVCDLCADSDNDFDPEGKRGKCKKVNERAQRSPKACEKRKKRKGVQKRCCPDPPVECPLCPEGKEFKPDNLDGKCAKIANRATKNQEVCDKMKGRKKPQRHCCLAPGEELKKEKPPTETLEACLGARDNKFVEISAKAGKCYSEVVLTLKSGQVSCAGPTWMSNWGCGLENSKGESENALVLVQHGTPSGKASQQKVIAPVDGTEGYEHSGRGHGHWYHMAGIGKDSPVMTWKLGTPIKAEADSFDLWYSEDLTDESESDNAGEACYDVKLTKARCP